MRMYPPGGSSMMSPGRREEAAAGSSHGPLPRRSTASRHPSGVTAVGVLIGSPAYDPVLGAAAIEKSSWAAATGWSSLQANSTQHAMDNNNHPRFTERIAELKARANELHVSAREGVVNLRAITEAADVMTTKR